MWVGTVIYLWSDSLSTIVSCRYSDVETTNKCVVGNNSAKHYGRPTAGSKRIHYWHLLEHTSTLPNPQFWPFLAKLLLGQLDETTWNYNNKKIPPNYRQYNTSPTRTALHFGTTQYHNTNIKNVGRVTTMELWKTHKKLTAVARSHWSKIPYLIIIEPMTNSVDLI